MVAVETIAETLLERLQIEDVVRISASEAEYLELADDFPYKLDYHKGEIIAMSLATFWHEVLVNSIGFLLEQFYRNKLFFVSNSNAGLQIQKGDNSYYQPDLMVVQGLPIFRPGSNCIITNPYLLVEILSPSTSKYDKDEKLPLYKDLPSLQYVVLVAQNRPFVSVYARTDQPDTWLNTDYKTLSSVARLGELALPLREIYHKIQFPG